MRALLRFFTPVRLLGIVVLLLVIVLAALHWLADLFWFQALGYAEVFWRLLLCQLGLFAAATCLVFLYAWGNLRLLARHVDLIGTAAIPPPGARALLAGAISALQLRLVRTIEVLAPLAAAMIVGFGFAQGWDDLLRFLWAQPFGETEPLYGHDIAFYLFDLPFLDRIQNTVAFLAFAATAALLVVYARAGLVAYRPGLGIVASRSVLHHLLANAALFLFAWASGYVLDRYELLTESTGAVFGAGYTAVHVTSWALWAAALFTVGFVVLAYAMVATGQARRLAMLAGGFVAAVFLILVVLPISVQRFVVLPNELALEEPYLRRDIAFTRKAFGLAAVEVRAYEPSATLDMAAIEANRDTISNIRLWDWQPLKQTFRQLQQIRSYYTFEDVDVDRYRLGDSHGRCCSRPASCRAICPARASPGSTAGCSTPTAMAWSWRRLPTRRRTVSPSSSSPTFRPWLRLSLGVTQPAIYYGEEDSGYRIVNTSVPEFDYPSGDENVYTSYKGHGDVVLDSWLKRLVYAWQQFDINILISDYVRADSRIQLWRQIQTRIAKIAPFLTLDHNPYLVRRWRSPVLDPGRLHHRRALSLRRAHREWRQLHPQLGQDRRRRLRGRP